MTDRTFATTSEKTPGAEDRLRLVLVPRQPVDGVPPAGISITLKKGATEDQANELSSLLNLLAVDIAPISK